MPDPAHPTVALGDEEVLERLRRLARDELEMSAEELGGLSAETRLVEGLQLDSLRQVVLVTCVEEEFGVELSTPDGERLRALRTVGDLIRLIRDTADTGRPPS